MNRNRLAWTLATLSALVVIGSTIAIAQNSHPEKSSHTEAAKGADGSAARGKVVFDKKCAICHNATTNEKKIGPGLKGIGKRGTFTVNSKKVTTESLTTWIQNGDNLMPPFKDVLDAAQIKDVVAYVKTL